MEMQTLKCYYTPEEYLELEAKAEYKNEYRDGEYYAMQYSKTIDGKWLLTEYDSENATIQLNSIDLQINFSDIYEQVNFNDGED